MSKQQSKSPSGEKPWSVPMAIAEVPDIGRQIAISADASIRTAIAKIANVLAIHRLSATFELTRQGPEGLRVVGKVFADIEQHCVLTLEPMNSDIEESIDLLFASQTQPLPNAVSDEVETPDIMHEGVVDLGALATEFLLLGIDPYPRKPGAVFTPPVEAKSEANQPFAALAALKKGFRGTGR